MHQIQNNTSRQKERKQMIRAPQDFSSAEQKNHIDTESLQQHSSIRVEGPQQYV